jgi:hypothetical protein
MLSVRGIHLQQECRELVSAQWHRCENCIRNLTTTMLPPSGSCKLGFPFVSVHVCTSVGVYSLRRLEQNIKSSMHDKLYTSLVHGAESLLRNRELCNYSRTFQHLMEPQGLLTYPPELSTGPYPEPDQSNPSHPIL